MITDKSKRIESKIPARQWRSSGESLTERNMAPCSSQSFSPGLLQITFNQGRCFWEGSHRFGIWNSLRKFGKTHESLQDYKAAGGAQFGSKGKSEKIGTL